MAAYYNEIDPFAAAWLRELIKAGEIAAGEVDERSIKDVEPDDLKGFTQCHFFAGIGGWSLSARLAGWPDDRPLWSGSCPCQPFSAAGKRGGTDDARHLWPDFFRLIRHARPPVVVGEQVAGSPGYGWFDGVRADLAGEDYASRCVDIPACAVDAPHIRQRLYWVAVADAKISQCGTGLCEGDAFRNGPEFTDCHGGNGLLADADSAIRGLADQQSARQFSLHEQGTGTRIWPGSLAAGVTQGDACSEGLQRLPKSKRIEVFAARRTDAERAGRGDGRPNGSFWADSEWIGCHDGKARRTEPGLPLLAHGIPNRVGQWRGFGNAIVPPIAAQVLQALMEGA